MKNPFDTFDSALSVKQKEVSKARNEKLQKLEQLTRRMDLRDDEIIPL